ncbi:VOC family protein [Sinimarinibacterium sp. CAU 1509]|uniref:VOC family protein n=1 Tax=Sinimarinibacterium sp. CAU 1509 TaxID=2562283 RepID=UPI0010ABAAD5|nr:VOC family protein [Sinimarinibacterium sp. CAU 1509]TJY64880.1 VOC family protein [Sinimarinibacterium sp. CAU 1509]
MIGYVTLGTRDLPRATAFYDALMSEMGAQRGFDTERLKLWWTAPGAPGLAVCTPFDGKEATIGNGDMVALAAKNREQVDALYNKAIELGATDEGAPGERFPGFYAGYFRDLDGNKLNFFFMG